MYAKTESSDIMSQDQKNKVAKAIIILVCLSAFASNSYLIFSQFIQEKTILSIDLITAENDMLQAPPILVCGKTSFKNVQLDASISDFEENSIKLSEFMVSSLFVSGSFSHSKVKDVSDLWQTFYTVYFGSCHKLELQDMVSEGLFSIVDL